MTAAEEKLLNVNELALALGRHRSYISKMKKWGFQMPGGKCTLAEARRFFLEFPDFRTHKEPPHEPGIFV